jgi:hypothetical protein
VELAIRCDDARMGGERERGQPARDELVRVLAECDVLCAVADESSEASAHRCGLDRRSLPLVVDELCGIEPGALLRVEPDVRPRLVRVACEQKPLTDSKSRVVPREGILCQSSVSRSCLSSGGKVQPRQHPA